MSIAKLLVSLHKVNYLEMRKYSEFKLLKVNKQFEIMKLFRSVKKINSYIYIAYAVYNIYKT